VRLNYELASAARVSLTIYDLAGREVSTLVAAPQSAGRHNVDWNAANMPSGIYLARLNAGSLSQTQKLVLLK